jgi:hypothetical protein
VHPSAEQNETAAKSLLRVHFADKATIPLNSIMELSALSADKLPTPPRRDFDVSVIFWDVFFEPRYVGLFPRSDRGIGGHRC